MVINIWNRFDLPESKFFNIKQKRKPHQFYGRSFDDYSGLGSGQPGCGSEKVIKCSKSIMRNVEMKRDRDYLCFHLAIIGMLAKVINLVIFFVHNSTRYRV